MMLDELFSAAYQTFPKAHASEDLDGGNHYPHWIDVGSTFRVSGVRTSEHTRQGDATR